MKNLLIFLFGAGIGFGGAMIMLRKSIKKQLDEMQKNMKQAEKEEEKEPFKVAEEPKKERDTITSQIKKNEKTAYNKMVDDYTAAPPVPIMDREDDDDGIEFVKSDSDEDFEPIDLQEFRDDKRYKQDLLIYYAGDKIMCTENGTKIETPAIFVGTQWENFVGNYKASTAFIRNNRNMTDYEIYVEDGLYQDDYGPSDGFHEAR